ncbi:F420-0:Gamma-glutamyl ligase [Okeania hirsuta]|uniref:F420-0:Gamma-glutamyl ligase n=2 Tax=Okeania TaxID=1458928 RepID=A0A3N6PU33_9CYAN|nr:F420-0:Gamma-glutamyl ligase [Okeania sp. SIO1H4]NET12734.1 F420-0:Gamma-glutamyl ligase [Okeania sp. SIO1H6]NET20924.1 F420-0:Gamma-glutamyl ligase [Okeania sp. SIO1H5]NET77760.1 F420-0:Gamma-glutamyl ligase [Okeania sp. SIO1F9]NET95886.1 F420-0:Gamma-glutamyl ligase [Okeania sp. SIO1H2]RQH42368.1 F420-0:Gamma-glutamyl ligase [Okeania hirsuta]
MIEIFTTGIIVLTILLSLGWLALELQYRSRPGNALELTSGEWHLAVAEPENYLLVGEMELCNRTKSLEIMVPEIQAEVKLLSGASLEKVNYQTQIIPFHEDAPARPDNYWFAYIVKVGKKTKLKISIDIRGENLDQLKSAWIKVNYITYGPQGRIPKTRHIVVPLKFPDPKATPNQREAQNATVFPIRTHLLTELDDPIEIVQRYVVPHAQPGDIVTIGETPLALIQGRFRHPTDVKPGWVAKRICYFFLPTSSLATACGMQTLVDIVGPIKVFMAFLGGAIAKLLGKPGMFYQFAGEQARLIDDVTGTLPPYDQFIVLGPENPQKLVEQIQKATGLGAAIVDVNDLKAVKILAATSNVSTSLLEEALRSNPAGNADEQTPVVLIRSSSS